MVSDAEFVKQLDVELDSKLRQKITKRVVDFFKKNPNLVKLLEPVLKVFFCETLSLGNRLQCGYTLVSMAFAGFEREVVFMSSFLDEDFMKSKQWLSVLKDVKEFEAIVKEWNDLVSTYTSEKPHIFASRNCSNYFDFMRTDFFAECNSKFYALHPKTFKLLNVCLSETPLYKGVSIGSPPVEEGFDEGTI